jgi:hypothetical protein
MTQVNAINTRQVKKIDGHTIFNIVKTMTGEPAAEIMRVIPPKMVPMIGKNDPQIMNWRNKNTKLRDSWDSDQQVSWGNALKQLKEWKRKAGDYNDILVKVGNKQAPPLPKIFNDWIKTNQPIPWTQRERDISAHEIMVNVLASNVSYMVRNTEKTRLRGLSNKKLEQTLFDVASTPLNNAPWSWRNMTTSKQREENLAKVVAKEEAVAVQRNLLKAWRDSPEAMSQEMLMYVGGDSPQYMMSWIIANTYQQANPLVKNIASKEGSYQDRVWRLNERYYPSINANDTLPKTTMNWPRYNSDPKILQVFTLPEIMKSLKSTFSSKQSIMANQQQLAFAKWKVHAEKTRDSLFQGNYEWTMNKILDNGLDYYNENNMNNSYTWYPDYHNQNYNTRKEVKVDPKDQILLSWPFIEKKLGAKKLKSLIDKREAEAKLKYDRITKAAKDDYDKITADIQAARTATTMKGKVAKK